MNISTLEQYVNQKNSWGKVFGDRALSLVLPPLTPYVT